MFRLDIFFFLILFDHLISKSIYLVSSIPNNWRRDGWATRDGPCLGVVQLEGESLQWVTYSLAKYSFFFGVENIEYKRGFPPL